VGFVVRGHVYLAGVLRIELDEQKIKITIFRTRAGTMMVVDKKGIKRQKKKNHIKFEDSLFLSPNLSDI
jgi:hypothetical protein